MRLQLLPRRLIGTVIVASTFLYILFLSERMNLSVNTASHDQTVAKSRRTLQTMKISNNVTYIAPYMFNWTILEEDFCNRRYPDLKLLMIVVTAPGNFENRAILRDMYGNNFYDEHGVALVFALGYPSNSTLQSKILNESAAYHDIIQQDFRDHYLNLTLKAVMWLEFASDYCQSAKYFFKSDDDMISNLFALVDIIKRREAQVRNGTDLSDTLTCRVFRDHPTTRNKKSKWYVPIEEIPEKKYPFHCAGMAILFPKAVMPRLLNATYGVRFHRFEDYFVTGRLGGIIGVKYDDLGSSKVITNVAYSSDDKFLKKKILFQLQRNMKDAKKLWEQLKKNYAVEKCKDLLSTKVK